MKRWTIGGLSGAFVFALYSPVHASIDEEKTPVEPELITNGAEAENCEFPSALAASIFGRLACSGTLIAPDVVLYAAHCITQGGGDPSEFRFGEDFEDPARSVEVDFCDYHPDYYDSDAESPADIAVCVLKEPVQDVAVTPIAMGCELESVLPGSPVALVGFGASDAWLEEGSEYPSSIGAGIKRYTLQRVDRHRSEEGYIDLVGNGTNSACFGDSGGPAFIRLRNGEVRTLGAASRLYLPEGAEFDPEHVCGIGVTYTLAYPFIDWLEDTTGRDLTPCFDRQGNWEPTANCKNFAIEPELGTGSWAEGCTNGGTSGYVATCGPAYSGPEPEPEPEPEEPNPEEDPGEPEDGELPEPGADSDEEPDPNSSSGGMESGDPPGPPDSPSPESGSGSGGPNPDPGFPPGSEEWGTETSGDTFGQDVVASPRGCGVPGREGKPLPWGVLGFACFAWAAFRRRGD